MSPEQAAGERAVDARSDQYALGAMTYEMFTGEPPHSGATAQNIDVRDIGARLRVATVLTGSVQRAGDKLRITAQLVNTSDGVSQWSDTFDRSAADIFAVQDEVTRALITALKGKV